MHRYYFIDSSGADTNLQLYTLIQAKKYWTDLEHDARETRQADNFHERCVFVICTIGLSVPQLLGQNNPTLNKRVPPPNLIFESLINENNVEDGLKERFKMFNEAYDQCRHFGLTYDARRHWEVSQVTFERTRELYEFGLLVWEIVISIYKLNPKNRVEDLDLKNIEHEL